MQKHNDELLNIHREFLPHKDIKDLINYYFLNVPYDEKEPDKMEETVEDVESVRQESPDVVSQLSPFGVHHRPVHSGSLDEDEDDDDDQDDDEVMELLPGQRLPHKMPKMPVIPRPTAPEENEEEEQEDEASHPPKMSTATSQS